MLIDAADRLRRALRDGRRLSCVATLLMLAALTGCRGSDDGVPMNVFAFGLGADPQTFDPGFMSGSIEGRVAYQIYEGLLSPAPDDGPPRPGVAERWDISDDGLVYTFHLRSDARWSNGDPVVAQDFRYAWLRMLRGDIAADYVSFVRFLRGARSFEQISRFMVRPLMDDVLVAMERGVGVEAPDERTLVVTLQQPTGYFLDIVMFYVMMPVHRPTIEQWGQEDAFGADHIVTNGPFMISRYERRKRLTMVPNPHYWAVDELGFDEVWFEIIEDNSARTTAYLDGRIDWMNDPPAQQLAFLAAEPGFRSAEQLGTYYYRFNVTRPPFDDVRVRRAFSLALNREELCGCTLDDLYTPATGFVPPLPGFPLRDLVHYDPDEARRLLAEAGYPGGRGFPTTSILYNTSENHRTIAQVVQDNWAVELGVDVQLINQEWKVYLETMEDLDYNVARAGWIGDYVDPDTFLSLWRSFDENNNTGYDNPQYDALMEAQIAETDPAERRAILLEAEELLIRDMPVMPIYFYSQFHLVNPQVRGWEMNVRDVHLIRWMSKEAQ